MALNGTLLISASSTKCERQEILEITEVNIDYFSSNNDWSEVGVKSRIWA
jgi:hypothetical protein